MVTIDTRILDFNEVFPTHFETSEMPFDQGLFDFLLEVATEADETDDAATQPLDVEALNKALKREEEIYANLQERKEQARRLEAAYWLSELDDTAE